VPQARVLDQAWPLSGLWQGRAADQAQEETQMSKSNQGPPIQFRPGRDIQSQLEHYAKAHKLTPNQAAKVLVAKALQPTLKQQKRK
jgi:hypothetical protein